MGSRRGVAGATGRDYARASRAKTREWNRMRAPRGAPIAARLLPVFETTKNSYKTYKRLEQPLTSTHTKSDHPFTLFSRYLDISNESLGAIGLGSFTSIYLPELPARRDFGAHSGLAAGDWLRIWFRELLLARPHIWQIFQSPFTVLFARTWGARAELVLAIARLIRLIPAHIKAYLE